MLLDCLTYKNENKTKLFFEYPSPNFKSLKKALVYCACHVCMK